MGLAGTAVPGVRAQFSVSNHLEVRSGEDPDTISLVPHSRLTRFNQFNLDYFHDDLTLGLRFETYIPSDDRSLQYTSFSNRYAEWRSHVIEARVGNFQALFGRGVVLRAFELPGVIREEFGAPQFGDSRDIDGVRLQAQAPRFELLAVSGRPRFADDPPDRERRGLVTGSMAGVDVLSDLRLGAEYVRLDTPGDNTLGTLPHVTEIGGGFGRLGFDRWLEKAGIESVSMDTWLEVAGASNVEGSAATSSDKLAPDKGRALYLAHNVFLAARRDLRLGLSWEYKDYQNFEFGVNEPPTLVREHTYTLLNRNTHVLDAVQEEGYQLETNLTYGRWASLVLNWSRAENKTLRLPPLTTVPADTLIPRRFREFYAELSGHLAGSSLSLIHADSDDGLEGLFDRQTWGVLVRSASWRAHGLELEYEQMTAARDLAFERTAFKDNYVSLGWTWAGRGSIAASRQTTDDPVDATDDNGVVSRRLFDALHASARLGDNHELRAFWGRRRSGIQCTAGTCYLVRGFEGVIVQLLSRF